MDGFFTLLSYGFKTRIKDFFVIIYNVVYPIILILLLGYLATNFFRGDSSVTSYNYYTIVLVPFFVLSSIITSAYAAKDESNSKTACRFMTSPISNASIVISKIISCTLIIWVAAVITIVFSMLVLGVQLNGKLPIIVMLFLGESIVASALGIFMGVSMKNFQTIKGILNIPLSVLGLLGGVFFPVGSLGSTFEKISYISPFTWINRAIIEAVYDNKNTTIMWCILVSILLGICISVLAVKSFKKEVFL